MYSEVWRCGLEGRYRLPRSAGCRFSSSAANGSIGSCAACVAASGYIYDVLLPAGNQLRSALALIQARAVRCARHRARIADKMHGRFWVGTTETPRHQHWDRPEKSPYFYRPFAWWTRGPERTERTRRQHNAPCGIRMWLWWFVCPVGSWRVGLMSDLLNEKILISGLGLWCMSHGPWHA